MKYLKWLYSDFNTLKLAKFITCMLLIVFGVGLINDINPLRLADMIGIFLINAGYMFLKDINK